MPKGVEHIDSLALASEPVPVRTSVMPKGVEHAVWTVTSSLGAGENLCDAERR